MSRTELDIEPSDRAPRRATPAMILAVVGYSVFIAGDDLTVVSTMLRPIIGDLGLTLPDGLDDAAWIVNAYLIAYVASMPVAGRLSDVIGRRRTFLGAYALFLVGSILILVSVTFDDPFGWFLFGRILTAIGGGAMVPVALAVVGDVYPERQRARAIGTVAAIETMGWVWGPLKGALLVRFLTWEWQFWMNIPLAIIGIAAAWWALAGQDRPERGLRLDWLGATLLTATLVSLSLALLGGAEIQSIQGLDELTGGTADYRWLYAVAIVCGALFVWQQRRSTNPLFDRGLFRGRNLTIALAVNFAIGAGLVIAMVDVPLFINSVEINLERAALYSGAVLSALTASMATFAYIGGRHTERTWYRPPVLTGLAIATGAFAWMGATWSPDTSYPLFAVQLALLGAGIGMTIAPTTSAVVDHAPADQRGAAASIVIVARLLGLSVGLSALTAWGLARFNALRSTIDLPPLTDPGFEAAVIDAQASLTAQAIAETFYAAAVVVGAGLLITFAMRQKPHREDTMSDDHLEPPAAAPAPPPGESHDEAHLTPAPDDPATADEPTPATARRTNLLIGALGILLAAAFATIAILFGRVADAREQADLARAELAAGGGDVTRAEFEALQAELERVEAGAALYASQIDGLQAQLTAAAPQISAGVDEAIAGLREFAESTIEFELTVDEVIPIDTEITINRTIDVPIQTEIPIDQTFETTVRVDTPLGELPLDISMPVDVTVPIDLHVAIPIDETVPIQDEFAVQLDVPIAIDVSETELANLAESIATGLESLQELLSGLTG